MTNSQRLAVVRTALRKWISDRHDGQDELGKPLSEAMLIRDGFFCGRRFRFQLYHAVWFLEEDEVKILSSDGTVASRLVADQIDALAQAWQQTAAASYTLSIAAHLENTQAAAAALPQQSDQDERSQGDRAQRRAA